MSSNNHPARDAEFLSRLHDGDLTAAERAHFESHRAHCGECRRAAAEFESALSLYRSSRPTPASPDLAGRILRKLQTGPGAPRRSRFGPSFGIDLRWAGAFAAAVVAAIVGSTIVGRHEAREGMARATGPAPIPIVVQSRADATPPPASAPPPPAGEVSNAPAQPAKASAPPRREALATRGARKNESPLPDEKPGAKEKKEQAAVSAQSKVDNVETGLAGKLAESDTYREENRPERQRAKPEAPAMMAQKAAPAPAAAAPVGAAVPVRVRVEALDGIAAPEVAGEVQVPASLRGLSWIVIVEPDGRVKEARQQAALDKRADAAAKDELRESAPKEILQLRFAPGDRDRRVLVRVE